MKKKVFKRAGAVLAWLLLCVFLAGSLAARSNRGSGSLSKYSALDEHPWDILRGAVKIELVAAGDDYVILRVWFSWSEEPVIIRIDRSYFGSGNQNRVKQGSKTKPAFWLGD